MIQTRREERRALEADVALARENLDGRLLQEPELELPPPPRSGFAGAAAAALGASLPPPVTAPAPAAGVGAPAPKRRGRPPKARPPEVDERLADLEAQRPRTPPDPDDEDLPPIQAQRAPAPEPAPAPPPRPRPAPPPPQPTRPAMSVKDNRTITYHQEQPHEAMAKHVEEGFGPVVWAEVRRLNPGGGTTTLKRNISMPITAWSLLGERFSLLLGGGGSFIIMLSQNRGEQSFVRWKENYEGPPRAIPPEVTLFYDEEKQDFTIGQIGIEAMGGIFVGAQAGAAAPNPYAAPLPPQPAGAYGPAPALPAFPRPAHDAGGRLLPPPESVTQPWMRGYPAQTQWELAREGYRQQYGVSPDANVALQWVGQQGREVEQARTQAARYEERLDATRDRSQNLLDTERQARLALERQLAEIRGQREADRAQAAAEKREADLRNEMKLLEMKITAASGGSPGKGGANEMTGLVAALAPIASAMISSQAERAAAEQRSRDDFNRMMLTMMAQQSKGPDFAGILTAAAPFAAPVFVRWLENQDPEKIDTAKHNADQRNLMLLKFMFDNLAQMNGGQEGEPEPWYVRFLKELAPGLMGMGQMALLEMGQRGRENAKGLPQGPETRGPLPEPRPGETQVLRPEDVPPDVQPEPVAPPAPTTSFALDINRTVESFAQADPQAAQMLGFILTELGKTQGAEGFMRHEWATILFHLHITPRNDEDLEERAEHTAVMLADLLEHDRTFALLPPRLLSVFTEPRAALMQIIPALPCWITQNKYAQRFVDLVVEEIQMREKDRLEAERETDEEEAGDEEEEGKAVEPGHAIVAAAE